MQAASITFNKIKLRTFFTLRYACFHSGNRMSNSTGGWRPQRSRKSTLICDQRRRAKALNLLMKQGLYSTASAPGHTFTHIYYDVTPIVRSLRRPLWKLNCFHTYYECQKCSCNCVVFKKKHYMETKLVNIDAYLYIQNYKSQT